MSESAIIVSPYFMGPKARADVPPPPPLKAPLGFPPDEWGQLPWLWQVIWLVIAPHTANDACMYVEIMWGYCRTTHAPFARMHTKLTPWRGGKSTHNVRLALGHFADLRACECTDKEAQRTSKCYGVVTLTERYALLKENGRFAWWYILTADVEIEKCDFFAHGKTRKYKVRMSAKQCTSRAAFCKAIHDAKHTMMGKTRCNMCVARILPRGGEFLLCGWRTGGQSMCKECDKAARARAAQQLEQDAQRLEQQRIDAAREQIAIAMATQRGVSFGAVAESIIRHRFEKGNGLGID